MKRERWAWICSNPKCNQKTREFLAVGQRPPKCKNCQHGLEHQVNNTYLGTRPGPHRAEVDARVKAAETLAKAAAIAKLAREAGVLDGDEP